MAEENKLIWDDVSEQIILITEKLAMEHGAKNVTVRRVLREMSVTNRVFYNRFHNIDEVLQIIYKRTVIKMRESLTSEYDVRTNIYEYVIDVCKKILEKTYDLKYQFSQYMFDFDSATEENRRWWMENIKEIIKIGKETNQARDIDAEMFSYTVWCFIRGFCADAIKRGLSKKDAKDGIEFGIKSLLNGVIKQSL